MCGGGEECGRVQRILNVHWIQRERERVCVYLLQSAMDSHGNWIQREIAFIAKDFTCKKERETERERVCVCVFIASIGHATCNGFEGGREKEIERVYCKEFQM